MSEENPSQYEANKLTRVLQGKPLKYTVRISYLDGRVLEFQSEERADIKYSDEDRCLWVKAGNYSSSPVCRYEQGMVILNEENPK